MKLLITAVLIAILCQNIVFNKTNIMVSNNNCQNNNVLSAVSFNVNGLCSSKPYLNTLLANYDVIGVSEHWLSGPELCKLDNLSTCHNVVYKCHNDLLFGPPERGRGYGGVAIFYNKTLAVAPMVDIKSDRIAGIKLKCSDKYFCILNVYMPQARNNTNVLLDNTIDELSGLIAEHNTSCNIIVMGDFNAHFGTVGGPRGRGPCSAAGQRILNALCNENVQLLCYDMSKYGSGPVFSFDRVGVGQSWIDHIFAPVCLANHVTKCGIIGEDILNVSDHLPVAIEFSLNKKCKLSNNMGTIEGQASIPSRVKWHKLTMGEINEKYTTVTDSIFESYFNDLQSGKADKDIDILASTITQKVLDVSKNNLCKPCIKSRCNPKPFWNRELSQLLKEKKGAYNAWRLAGRPRDPENPLFIQHNESKKIFRKKLRISEAVFRAEVEENIEACNEIDQRQFWYLLKKGRTSQRHGSVLKDTNGEIISEKDKVLNTWKDHFRDLGSKSDNPNFDSDFKEYVEAELENFCTSDEEMDTNVFSQCVSADEVEKVCSNLKSGKAQDYTGLSYEHFKHAGKHVYIVLALLFNCIIDAEVLPKIFLKGLTIPLFKGGEKDPLDKNDYRGISIQSVLCKIYDTVIINRSSVLIKDKLAICNTQSACEKGLSSAHASLLLQETVSHNVENRSPVYVTFFDAKKAFDTVWIEGLFFILYCNGIRGKLWRLLRKAYIDCWSAVLVNGSISDWFLLLQGVKQGAVLSMLLYLCFINGLIKEILASNMGCHVLGVNSSGIGYADDLAILALNKVSMQQMIDIAYRYSCKWRFEFNPKKCAVLIFGNHAVQVPFVLGNAHIKTMSEYTHVGVNIATKQVTDLCQVKKRIELSKRAMYSLVGCSLYKTCLSPLALSKLYWSVVIPKLLGNAEVRYISDTEMVEYEKFHRSVAQDIQHLPKSAPNPSVLALLGWRDLMSYLDYVKLMFLYRILALQPKCIYRVVFIRRLFYILSSGIYSQTSPVANIVKVCSKYDILHIILEWLANGYLPGKAEWKTTVKNIIKDNTFAHWRFEIMLYSKLSIYRIINNFMEPSCWWVLAKALPFLKSPCCTMVKLMCGSNCLAVNKKCELPRSDRLCTQCNVVEDVIHFIMFCTITAPLKEELYKVILNELSTDGRRFWSELSSIMQLYILLGLDFPLPSYDLYVIRHFGCIFVHRMYKLRKSFEPP
jgi:exonuclease III